MSGINVTELNASLGAYLRTRKNILIGQVSLGADFEKRFEVMEGVEDELPLPRLEVGDLVQPGRTGTWNPTNNALGFKARIAKARSMKVDLVLTPSDLYKTWLGALRKPGTKVTDLPFEKFIFDHIISKARENVYLNAIYKGTYDAAGGTPGATMDGWLKLIADEITANNLSPIATGAITATNVEDKLLAVYDGLHEAVKNTPTQMKVNAQIFDWYIRNQRKVYGGAGDYTGVETTLFGANCELIREPGLGTSQRVICTPKANMVYVLDSLRSSNNITTEVEKRDINLMMDFNGGVQFKEVNDKVLAVNDQA